MKEDLLEQALEEYASSDPDREPDPFEPRYVKVGKFDIRYALSKKEASPTLVLLNALPQSIRVWESFWDELSENFNLLAFDVPGFGLTRAEEEDMSPRKLSRIVIQVMDHFGIQKAHLIGPDIGVPISLATAIENPDRLESINIFDGPGSYPPKMASILLMTIKYGLVRWLANVIQKKAVMKENFNTAVNRGYNLYKPTTRAVKEYYQITHDDQMHRCAMAFLGSYKSDLPWIQDRLKDIKVPALITWGKLDPFVSVENADFLSKNIPTNKLVVFENASHFSHEDAGKEYLDLITEWCQSI